MERPFTHAAAPGPAILAWPAALVAALAGAYAVVVRPVALAPLLAAGLLLALAFVATPVALVVALAARNTGDALAEYPVVGDLNAGALIGILVIGVAGVRIVLQRPPRGLGAALFVAGVSLFWFAVGVEIHGADQSLVREVVRVLSVVAVALIALNASDVRRPSAIAGAVVVAGLVPAVVAVWQLAVGEGIEDTTRVYGTLSHPSGAAALFSVCLALCAWKLIEERAGRRYLAAAVLFAVALLGTASLAGMARILVTLLVYAVIAGRLSPRSRGVALVALVLAIAFAASPLGSERLAELGRTTSPAAAARTWQTENTLDWRFMHWSRLLVHWREQPVLGNGIGSTQELIQPDGYAPHSDPIRILVEMGVVGLAVAVAAAAMLWRRLVAHWREGGDGARYVALVIAVVAGMAVQALTDNVSNQTAALYAAAALIGSAFLVRGRPA